MISKHLIKYVLIAAMRDKLMMTLALMILIGAAIAVFMGSATTTEADSFSLVFGSGGLRFLGVIGIVLFCCFYIRRSFDSKEVEFLLSRPISRLSFLFSHAVAFSILSFLVAGMIAAIIAFIGNPDMAGLFIWSISIAVEFAIMSVASLFFSMVLSSAAGSALATLGFYALSRMVGVVLGIISHPTDNLAMSFMGGMMKFISVVIPRFDMMGQTTWLVYGVKGSAGMKFMPNADAYVSLIMEHIGLLGFVSLQGFIFIALLLAASSYDFMRRQF